MDEWCFNLISWLLDLERTCSWSVELHNVGDDGLEHLEVVGIVNAVLEGNVHRVVLAFLVSSLASVSSAREEVWGVFVQRNAHNAVCVVESILYAIAMMNVNVNVQDARVVAKELLNGEHNIVDIAEARALTLSRVMQASCPVNRHIRPLLIQAPCTLDTTAGVQLAKVVNRGETRTIIEGEIRPRARQFVGHTAVQKVK